jgi:putative transposase
VALAVAGANRPDGTLLGQTIASVPIRRPRPTPRHPHGMCLDKAYDLDAVYTLLTGLAFTAHVRARGEEVRAITRRPGVRARRWVVERTHSWMNRFRALLVRWDKQTANYLASLHLACAYITFGRADLLG